MLFRDEDLSEDTYRYEIARRDRRIFQMSTSLVLVVVTSLVSTFGVDRLISGYAFVTFWLLFNEALRRVLRRVGESNNVLESAELARVAPFCMLVSFVLAWIVSSELLVGTGVLSTPFGRTWLLLVTAFMFLLAVLSTWSSNELWHDRASTLIWISLLIPLQDASPRTSTPLLSISRVIIALTSHFALMARSEGRLSPSKYQSSDSSSMAGVVGVAANNSARKLVQSAWILKAWPPALLGVIVIFLLNEYVAAKRVQPRQVTSPPPSPPRVQRNNDFSRQNLAIEVLQSQNDNDADANQRPPKNNTLYAQNVISEDERSDSDEEEEEDDVQINEKLIQKLSRIMSSSYAPRHKVKYKYNV